MKKYFMPLTALCLCSLMIVASLAQQAPPPTLGQIKAGNFVVTTTDGKNVPLNKLIGEGKPVVIDLWATWCGPCRQEIPHLLELARQYRKDGLIVVGLTVEDPETERPVVKKFVKELAMTYPVAFAPKGLYLMINGGSMKYRIPQTMVFGADGRIVKRLIGYNEKIGKEILTKAVEQAVAPSGKPMNWPEGSTWKNGMKI